MSNKSELQAKVEQEIANDAEQSRINFLKYINYGKRLEQEQSGAITQEQLDKAVADGVVSAKQATTALIFEKIEKLEAQVGSLQQHVEIESEKEPLSQLKLEFASRPDALAALQRVDEIIKNVDQKHTAILKDVRAVGFKAIKDEFAV
jgi:hypothetical protein